MLILIKFITQLLSCTTQKMEPDLVILQVTHYQYTSWPDHGAHQFATSILSFVRRVQKAHDKSKGIPLLVHCSAGVGRTGMFIVLDTLLARMRSETCISVFEVVKEMRRMRVQMVQTQVPPPPSSQLTPPPHPTSGPVHLHP